MDNLDMLYAWGMIGWIMFALVMVCNFAINKKWRGVVRTYQKASNDWSKAYKLVCATHGELTKLLYEVKIGKRKSFVFNGARFRLCYEGKKRNANGKYVKGPKKIKEDGVLKFELGAKQKQVEKK